MALTSRLPARLAAALALACLTLTGCAGRTAPRRPGQRCRPRR